MRSGFILMLVGFSLLFRPLIGVPLVVAAIAGFAFLISKLLVQKKRQSGLAPS